MQVTNNYFSNNFAHNTDVYVCKKLPHTTKVVVISFKNQSSLYIPWNKYCMLVLPDPSAGSRVRLRETKLIMHEQ